MHPVTSTQLVDHLGLGAPLPGKPVVVSFDDASGGQFTTAAGARWRECRSLAPPR
jgi:hypothetical protein